MNAIKDQISGLIDSHTKAHGTYRDCRFRVALGEMHGVFTPDEVDRLELALANVYEMLHDNSAELARIAALVEFAGEGTFK